MKELSNIRTLLALFPPTFNPLIEAAKVGVKGFRITSLPHGLAARYDVEAETILLNPDTNWAREATEINRLVPFLGLGATAQNAIVWTFFHESFHHMRRERLLRMPKRNLRATDLSITEIFAIRVEEVLATKYANCEFCAWRKTSGGKP